LGNQRLVRTTGRRWRSKIERPSEHCETLHDQTVNGLPGGQREEETS
jgi:hypothetical protein